MICFYLYDTSVSIPEANAKMDKLQKTSNHPMIVLPKDDPLLRQSTRSRHPEATHFIGIVIDTNNYDSAKVPGLNA